MVKPHLLLLLALATALCPRAAAAQTPGGGNGGEVLRPGDVVRITVWRKPELSGEVVVGADGKLKHPLYKSVVVGGVPLSVVEQRLATEIGTYESNPQFVLEPLLRVTVAGEVRQPSLYSLAPETTISQAVALAGGAGERGRLDQVRVVRGGRELLVDLTRPDARWATASIQSGDQIVVGRRRDTLRDFVGPVAALIGAAAAISNILIRRP